MAAIVGLLLYAAGSQIGRAIDQGQSSAIAPPGSGVVIAGAWGLMAGNINGIYEATGEVVDKVTVFRRIDGGDDEIYLYYCKLSERWKISDRNGRRTKKYFAYQVSIFGKMLPHEVVERPWFEVVQLRNRSGFTRNDQITVRFIRASYMAELRATMRLQGGTPTEAMSLGITAAVDPATGRTFYFDTATGESTWDLPPPVAASASATNSGSSADTVLLTASPLPVPEGYTTHFCSTYQRTFYNNTKTGESSWEFPTTGLPPAASGTDNGTDNSTGSGGGAVAAAVAATTTSDCGYSRTNNVVGVGSDDGVRNHSISQGDAGADTGTGTVAVGGPVAVTCDSLPVARAVVYSPIAL